MIQSILLIIFVISLIIPFAFSIKWGLITITWIVGLSPILSMLIFSLFKGMLQNHVVIRDIVIGFIEGLLLLLIFKLNPPHIFIYIVPMLYIVNQFIRAVKQGALNIANEEFRQIIGYFIAIPIIVSFL